MPHHGFRKTLFATFIFVALMLIISGSGFILQAARAQADRDQKKPAPLAQEGEPGVLTGTVKVTGSAEVRVQPDAVIVWVGVETAAGTASAALDENNQQVGELIAALTDTGFEREAIQTQSVQLFPRYSNAEATESGTAPGVVGYTARNTVELHIADDTLAGEILDAAVQAGANTIDGIQFIAENRQEAEDQARELALEDATRKAEQLAALAGAELGTVLAIDASSASPSPLSGAFGSGGAESAAAAPVFPGTQTVRVDLTVTYEMVGAGVLPSTGQPSGGIPTGTVPGTAASTEVVASLSITPLRGAPGTTLVVRGSGFPADTALQIGLGREGQDYEIVDRVLSGEDGALSAQVIIPENAEVNDQWFVVAVIGEGASVNEISSNLFTVTGP